MKNPSDEQFALRTIQALVGALSHKLRTPLSVVQNDLSYLATVFAPEEFVRPIERCKQISQVLGASRVPKIEPLNTEALSPLDVVGQQGWELESELDRAILVSVNRAALTYVTKQWLNLFQSVDVQSSGYLGPMRVSQFEGSFLMGASCKVSRDVISNDETYSYFIEPFYNLMNLDSIEAPLIDAVVAACGWRVELSINQNLITANLRV